MDYKEEKRVCQSCKNDFTIEVDDFNFYEKINVPPPTWCPDCRRTRRWAWRNNMSLYNRKCELCDKSVVSVYAPNSPIKIYCNKCWWGDNWDPKSFATDYDFSRPFFSQFNELVNKVPHMSVVNDDGIASKNCEYTHDWWFSKNCYMCFSGWHVENVMYSYFILQGKYIMDCINVRSPNEYLYECNISAKSYQLKYSELTKACIDSQFLYDCYNCQDCFMCVYLRGKKYCFKNKQYSEEEYKKILASYQLDTFSGVKKAEEEFNNFLKDFFRKFEQNLQSTNVTGYLISHSKNIKNSFIIKNAEFLRHSDFVGDSSKVTANSWDITTTGGSSECYECVVGDHSQLNRFGLLSVKSQDIEYCQHCHNCKHCFGCVGLRNAKYCIFNKEYSKEEYEEIVTQIKKQMNEVPYINKRGIIYRYGEFFPIEFSPFGYNETYAPELLSLSKEEALERGYNWQDSTQKTTGKETLLPEKIPDSINDIDEKILEEILKCIDCGRNYKIIQNEFLFYKKMNIPIPRRCFMCRYKKRVAKRLPFKLWHRSCMCESEDHGHNGRCAVEFETSYSPDRLEKIYCENCYNKEIY